MKLQVLGESCVHTLQLNRAPHGRSEIGSGTKFDKKKNVFSLLLKNSLGNCKKIKYKNGKKNDSLKRKTEKVFVTSLRFYDVQACTLFQRDMMK